MQDLFSHALNIVEDECTEIENSLESGGHYDLAARQLGEDTTGGGYGGGDGFYYEGADSYGAYYDGADGDQGQTYYDEQGNIAYYEYDAAGLEQQNGYYHDDQHGYDEHSAWDGTTQKTSHDPGWYYDETHGGWLYDYSYAAQSAWEAEGAQGYTEDEKVGMLEGNREQEGENPVQYKDAWGAEDEGGQGYHGDQDVS